MTTKQDPICIHPGGQVSIGKGGRWMWGADADGAPLPPSGSRSNNGSDTGTFLPLCLPSSMCLPSSQNAQERAFTFNFMKGGVTRHFHSVTTGTFVVW